MCNFLNKGVEIINPFVKNTWRRRLHVKTCKTEGHILTGTYYGMPQSHCRRCGAPNKTNYAGNDYVAPWGEYK